MLKVILVILGAHCGSSPTVAGRTGVRYPKGSAGRLHWNSATRRHESVPMDVSEWNEAALDIWANPAKENVVPLFVDVPEPIAAPAPVTVPVETPAPVAELEAPAPAAGSVEAMNFRELRALCKEKGIEVLGSDTKATLISKLAA